MGLKDRLIANVAENGDYKKRESKNNGRNPSSSASVMNDFEAEEPVNKSSDFSAAQFSSSDLSFDSLEDVDGSFGDSPVENPIFSAVREAYEEEDDMSVDDDLDMSSSNMSYHQQLPENDYSQMDTSSGYQSQDDYNNYNLQRGYDNHTPSYQEQQPYQDKHLQQSTRQSYHNEFEQNDYQNAGRFVKQLNYEPKQSYNLMRDTQQPNLYQQPQQDNGYGFNNYQQDSYNQYSNIQQESPSISTEDQEEILKENLLSYAKKVILEDIINGGFSSSLLTKEALNRLVTSYLNNEDSPYTNSAAVLISVIDEIKSSEYKETHYGELTASVLQSVKEDLLKKF